MSPREIMYKEGSSDNKDGITYSQCSTEDNTKISQQNNSDIELRNTDLLKSRYGTKRKLLCRNEVESELNDCCVVLNKVVHSQTNKVAKHLNRDLIEELPEDENIFQKLKDSGATVKGRRCETKLPRLHYEESVPMEIIYKGVPKQQKTKELKNIVKKNIITKEERNVICIPNFPSDLNTGICRDQHVTCVIKSNKGERPFPLNKNEDVESVILQSKRVLGLLPRYHSIPVDKFYNKQTKKLRIEDKCVEKKVEREVQSIKDKCMERKINITKINDKFAETPTLLDESKLLVCDSRESDPLALDEENMQIKSMVRTYFSGCNSGDSVCCNACRPISENASCQHNLSNECSEIETNSPVMDTVFTEDRGESSEIRNSSSQTNNALKGTNEDMSIGRIKCCECNMRFSTTQEVSKHLKTSGCYRKSKAKSKGVQKPTLVKVQDSREKIAAKFSRHNSSSSCGEGWTSEEGDSGFSSPMEFSGAASTPAFHAMNDIAPAFHATDGSRPSFHDVNSSSPPFHGAISSRAAFHKTDGFSLSFHPTDDTTPANKLTDSTGSMFHAADVFHSTNGSVFHASDNTSPVFCAANIPTFNPIYDTSPAFNAFCPIDGTAPVDGTKAADYASSENLVCKRTRDDPAVLNPTSVACDINPVFDARISPVLDTASVCTPFPATNFLSVIASGSPAFHSPSSASPNDFLPLRDVGGDSAASEIPQDISELLFSCDMTCTEAAPSFLHQLCDNRQDFLDNLVVSQPASISRSASSSPGSTMTSRYSTDVSRSNSPELSSRSTSPLLSSLSRCTTPEESKPSGSTSPPTLPGTLLGNISQILSQNGVPKLSSTTQLKPHSTHPKSTMTSFSSPEISRSDTFSHMFGLPVSRWYVGTLCCPTSRYSTVLKHINAHRKHQIRNYRCIGCNVKTSDYTKFINHIKQKNHHAKNAKHECGEEGCRLIFPSEASKEIHRKECHQKVSSYCKACGTQVVTVAGERAFKVLAVPSIGEHALKVHRELWM